MQSPMGSLCLSGVISSFQRSSMLIRFTDFKILIYLLVSHWKINPFDDPRNLRDQWSVMQTLRDFQLSWSVLNKSLSKTFQLFFTQMHAPRKLIYLYLFYANEITELSKLFMAGTANTIQLPGPKYAPGQLNYIPKQMKFFTWGELLDSRARRDELVVVCRAPMTHVLVPASLFLFVEHLSSQFAHDWFWGRAAFDPSWLRLSCRKAKLSSKGQRVSIFFYCQTVLTHYMSSLCSFIIKAFLNCSKLG